jgi:short-subunit dehydrogenase
MQAKNYTLITGGSQGIGKALALECAARGQNVLLVALPGKELDETAREIRKKHAVWVHFLPLDLTKPEAPKWVYEWCRANDYRVNFLINNAGLAGTAVFTETDPVHFDQMVLLNVRATVLLTRHFLPMLKAQPGSRVLIISSLSAFFAIPYKTVYAATKSFLLQFSKALHIELIPSGIQVSVVCPNGVETNPGTRDRIRAHGRIGRMVHISAADLARYTLDRVDKGKTLIIPKRINRLLVLLKKFVPYSIEKKLLAREFGKEVSK